MSYVQISRGPGFGWGEYEKVRRRLGPATPVGQSAHHVGVVDGVLIIVDVWDSRADADRFAAEILFPAMERAGVALTSSAGITGFEAFENGVPA